MIYDPGRSEPAAVAVEILFSFLSFCFSLVLSRGALVFFIAMLFCLKLTKDEETSPFCKKYPLLKPYPERDSIAFENDFEIRLKRISFVYFLFFL